MQLTVKKDRSEQFVYNSADFPVYTGKGNIAGFPNHTALGHWHDDLEFSVALRGGMDYNINGETVHLDEGEGIFINTRQMHYNFSREHRDCEYICVLLHPVLLCASQYVESAFVTPILENQEYPYQALRRGSEWGRRVCGRLREIFDMQGDPLAPIMTQAAFFNIWIELYKNAPLPRRETRPRGQSLSALKSMIAFIQKRYQERISLEEIARAGSVSKTTCCKIFQKYVNQSPNAYLIEYRLRSGIELLLTTDMTVTEICYETGFSGPSYFSESFRKTFGCSPTDYRKKGKGAQNSKFERLL